jgi:UDP-glucose 4-epimerase
LQAQARTTEGSATRVLVRAARESGCERVVFASSAAVYGATNTAADLPLTETAPTQPASPFAHSKLEAERLLAQELSQAGIDYAILRLSTVYGPRQAAAGGLVAALCAALAAKRQPTLVGDGSSRYDFVYVADVVSALVSCIGGDIAFAQALPDEQAAGAGQGAADSPAPATTTAGIYNIASGQGVTGHELMRALQRLSGQFEDFAFAPAALAAKDELANLVLDAGKARQVFEWEPRISLEQGLSNTWTWFERHAEHYEQLA